MSQDQSEERIAQGPDPKGRSSGRALLWSVLALLSGAAATGFFTTAGLIDPLRDAMFSLAIALDLSVILFSWQAVKAVAPAWLAPYTHFRVRRVEARQGALTGWVRTPAVPRAPMLWDNPLWRWLFVALAFLLGGTAIGLHAYQMPLWQVYAAWALSLLALLLAYLPWQRPSSPFSAAEGLALLVILAVAGVLRSARLAWIPLAVHPDTASVGLEARRLLASALPDLFRFGWDTTPMWGFVTEAVSMAVLGDSLVGLRAAAVFSGIMSLLGVYALGREGWNRRVGLLAAAVLAIDVLHVHFSRIPFYVDPVPWVVWALFFLIRGYRRRSPFSWALSGLAAAIAANMYISGYLALGVVLVTLVYLRFFHSQSWRQVREGVAAWFLAFFLTQGPMLVTVVQQAPELAARLYSISLWNGAVLQRLLEKYQATSFQDVFWAQVQRTLLTYQYYGDASELFGYPYPMLHFLLAPLFLVGAGIATGRLRHQGNFVLSAWLFLGLTLGSILAADAPYWPRLLVIVPANALAIALGALWLVEMLSAQRRWAKGVWGGVLAITLVSAGWFNWTRYMENTALVAGEPDFAARFMLSLEDRVPCFVEGAYTLDEPVFAFLLHDVEVVPLREGRWAQDVARCAQRHGVVVALPEDRPRVLDVQQRLPGGRLEEVRGPAGSPNLIVYWLPTP